MHRNSVRLYYFLLDVSSQKFSSPGSAIHSWIAILGRDNQAFPAVLKCTWIHVSQTHVTSFLMEGVKAACSLPSIKNVSLTVPVLNSHTNGLWSQCNSDMLLCQIKHCVMQLVFVSPFSQTPPFSQSVAQVTRNSPYFCYRKLGPEQTLKVCTYISYSYMKIN